LRAGKGGILMEDLTKDVAYNNRIVAYFFLAAIVALTILGVVYLSMEPLQYDYAAIAKEVVR